MDRVRSWWLAGSSGPACIASVAIATLIFSTPYGSSGTALAQEPSARAPIPPATVRVEDLIPVPEPADVPPPSKADIEPSPETTAGLPVEARIPLPESADVPPPTAADFDRAEAQTEPAETDTDRSIEALVPVPEPVDVAPITARDIEPGREAAKPEDDTVDPVAESTEPPTEPTPETGTASTPADSDQPDLAAEADVTSEEEAVVVSDLTGKDLIKAPLAAQLSATDRVVAEKLRDLIANRLDRYVDRSNERPGVEVFYRDRGFAPLWVENGERAARAQAAARFLRSVDEDGFDPVDYPVPSFPSSDPDAMAEAELRLTASALRFARHASIGRVHYTRVSGDIEYDLKASEPGKVLAGLGQTTDVAAELAQYHPQHAGYQALKAKLAEARKVTGKREVVRIPAGPILRLGMEDSRVPVLRKRLDIPGEPDDWRYDEDVVEAVIAFQKDAGLAVDGMAGPATLRALNGPNQARTVDMIIANMERWRWMPRDLGNAHVVVNIPDFSIRLMHDDKKVWQTKTVVGRTSRKTPIISTEMRSITVNPTWNVPPGIMKNDYIPVLQQDPSALSRAGIRVEQNRDGTLRMYQPPGDRNALGRLRFNTPNRFLVYLHDTPDKHLFDRGVRAYSSGCMRVENPAKFAELILSILRPEDGYTQERVRAMFGPSERTISFPKPLPVHLTYQTAFVDDAGKLQLHDDVYGHDAELIKILNGSDRQVADIAIKRRPVQVARDELRLPDRFSERRSGFGPRYGYSDGDNARYRYRRYGDRYPPNPFADFFGQIFR